jgi:hypothetical protein
VSQIYAHRSESTYPEHYQAHCSSIDTVGDVLDEEEETYHIAYFQGYRQFREVGLPSELPAEMKEAILRRPELVEARDRLQELLTKADFLAAEHAKHEYRKLHTHIRLSELYRHQSEWFQERRDWRVLNRGRNDPECPESNTCTRALALIMPELGSLAAALSSSEPLSFDERLLFAEQLLTQCRRDYDVIYLPGEAPTDDGKCPVDDCQADIQK